ncbi:MAG TPA: phosphate ABC transporter permease subunit PstC [Dehalococcoidia bacterium]|nr:phosphate ABC transporter permease subunit PstC [Dehalococcoidia bacterium]
MSARDIEGPPDTAANLSGRSYPFGEIAFRAILMLAVAIVLGILIGLFVELSLRSRQSFSANGWSFLWTSTWDPVHEVFGILPFFYGTLFTAVSAMILATLLGVGVALFLVELSPRIVARPVGFMVEMLAAIPSVVYGLWGIFVLAPWLRRNVEVPLHDHFGGVPLFSGYPIGIGYLAAIAVLTVMVLPTVAAVSRDVIAAVPQSQREAALAIGATRWEMIRIAVLPFARSGIVGASILGLARGVGETLAVAMVIGASPNITLSLFDPGYTMAAVIANEFAEATTDLYRSTLIEVGLVLFLVTLLINIVARLLVWRVTGGERSGGALL